MQDQKLLTQINLLESRIALLEQQSNGEKGFMREDNHAWPIPSLAVGDSVEVSADGPFSPVYEEDEETDEPTDVVAGFQNCYWQNGGVTMHMEDQEIPGTDGFVALKAGATPYTSGTATLECYESFAALQAAQQDVAYFIVPLYRVADSKITLDMRRMPVVFTAEILS